ncbi:hypothetical protein [Variovorax atrisoli]|uniref:hypothetical protein n=1 Tax=Variovorax atrisoli TaxID=3394203 RepID=UPI00160E27BB|nr:hypothetical protein [Variovorax sp. BK613]MBB3642597.1 hypothetical protein [Variovorax sp. BK613]
MGEIVKRVIRCNESNAPEFLAMVNRWPELKALVRSLRDAGLFPGLRGLQVTLTGTHAGVSEGLASVGGDGGSKKGGVNAG